MEQLKFRGRYSLTMEKNGIILAERKIKNLTPTAMVNHMFDVVFGGSAANATWYIGLINNTPTPVLAQADTLASHAGWVEFTSYTGNRQEWVDSAAASRAKTGAAAVFPITGTGTVYGLFLASVASGTSGVLGSEGAFDIPLPVINGANCNVVFTIEAD